MENNMAETHWPNVTQTTHCLLLDPTHQLKQRFTNVDNWVWKIKNIKICFFLLHKIIIQVNNISNR